MSPLYGLWGLAMIHLNDLNLGRSQKKGALVDCAKTFGMGPLAKQS